MSKPKNKSDNKTEKALAAEKEQFGKQQVSNWFSLNEAKYYFFSSGQIILFIQIPFMVLCVH